MGGDRLAHPLVVFARLAANSPSPASRVVGVLKQQGYQVTSIGSGGELFEVIKRRPPRLLIEIPADDAAVEAGPVEPEHEPSWRATARHLGIPLLVGLPPGTPLTRWTGLIAQADDWVVLDRSGDELQARVEALLVRRASATTPGPIDTRFCGLVVHDLRTPLNVIGLSLRMIEKALPKDDPDVVEDLGFIEENFRQIEFMLTQLGDYSRLFERELRLTASGFSPRRLLEEIVESRSARPGQKRSIIQMEVDPSAPAEAVLDQVKARMAIEYALTNAVAATQGEPVRLIVRGAPGRLILEMAVDRPPPSSVSSLEFRPGSFERLCGNAAERRGMDLAIAARVSELFGGSARLEAVDGRGTSVILDWPDRVAGG